MKKPAFFPPLLLILSAILLYSIGNAQIAGSSGSLSVDPSTSTIVDPLITVGGNSDLTGATVQITANYYNGDILSFDEDLAQTFNITGSYATTAVSGILTFTGTTSPANWQTIFRTVTYQNNSASCGPSSRTIVFLQGSYLYNSYNGHYYEFVNDNLNWKDAKAAAALRSFNGMQGYLATSSSEGENNFIWKLMAADAWVGASYDYEEINAATGTTTYADQNAAMGNVYWVTGPEKGTFISSGLESPVSQNGQYMNWTPGEPNNFVGSNEFYVQLYSGNQGYWNDLPIASSLPYLVEYGGMPGDAPQSNTYTRSLTLTSTIGGDILGGDVSVCAGSNSTTLTTTAAVSGVTIVRWESSTDNFLTAGTVINNTTNTLTVNNLTQTTYFRSIANGNSCSEAPSSATKITVGNSVPGTLSAAFNTICNGSVAQLTLTGNNGDVVKWQTSPDNISWSDIANTSAVYTTVPLSAGTYYYQAEVQNPSCPSSVFSNSVMITVTSAAGTVGGTLSGAQNACGPGNSGLITLSGYAGSIIKWQSSTDNGIIWNNISNITDTYTFNNISATTKYRAVLQNASCNPANSSVITVVYSPASNRWNGSVSTDFGDAGNWDCAVPASGTNIVIGSGAPNMPILDQDRTIGNIIYEDNTSIDINGHVLTVIGTLTGTNLGSFTGSATSSLIIGGSGSAGTIYFNQSSPGTSNTLGSMVLNRNTSVIATPPSSPVCSPTAPSAGGNGIGIVNVKFETIDNATTTDNGYENYFETKSTQVDPSTDYTLSITTGSFYSTGIKVWIDWNNNGIFGDETNEIIVDHGGGYPGTFDFTVYVPAIGGDISGGSKTMRILGDIDWIIDGLDACSGQYGDFEDYKINLTPLPIANGSITLGNDLSINNSLTLTNGLINTSSNLLILSAGSTISGASNGSYVNGNVRKTGNTAFTFPIGDSVYYAPVGISAPSDASDQFTASYKRVDPLSDYNNSNFMNNLVSISNNEYWLVERTNGNSNVEVTLSWDAARSSSLTNLGLLRVAHWNGTAWTDAGNSGATTGDLTAGTITSTLVTSFSPFTIGISSFLLPVTDLNFTAVKVNQRVNLAWQTTAEVNSNRFEIERSIDGNAWQKIGQVSAKGTSTSASSYSFADITPANGNNYYRLKQFDNDDRFVYSPVRVVNFSSGSNVTVYPNPFSKSVTIDAGNKVIGNIIIADLSGRIVYKSTILSTRETINLSHLAAGQYTVIQKDNYFKIIKL